MRSGEITLFVNGNDYIVTLEIDCHVAVITCVFAAADRNFTGDRTEFARIGKTAFAHSVNKAMRTLFGRSAVIRTFAPMLGVRTMPLGVVVFVFGIGRRIVTADKRESRTNAHNRKYKYQPKTSSVRFHGSHPFSPVIYSNFTVISTAFVSSFMIFLPSTLPRL